MFFFFQAEDGIRDRNVTGVQTCALPIFGDAGDADAARGIGLHLGQVEFGGDAGELADRVQVEVAEGPAPRRGRRSEERRVGKEGRARGAPEHENKSKTVSSESRTAKANT